MKNNCQFFHYFLFFLSYTQDNTVFHFYRKLHLSKCQQLISLQFFFLLLLLLCFIAIVFTSLFFLLASFLCHLHYVFFFIRALTLLLSVTKFSYSLFFVSFMENSEQFLLIVESEKNHFKCSPLTRLTFIIIWISVGGCLR